MAHNFKRSIAVRNLEADTLCARLNSGYIRIYDGSQPASPNTAVSTQTLLAELRFGSTAFAAASSGVATANAITQDSAADATGIATWFRAFKSDGTTAEWDGTVGTSGADCNLVSTSIVSGGPVSVTNCTYTAG